MRRPEPGARVQAISQEPLTQTELIYGRGTRLSETRSPGGRRETSDWVGTDSCASQSQQLRRLALHLICIARGQIWVPAAGETAGRWGRVSG